MKRLILLFILTITFLNGNSQALKNMCDFAQSHVVRVRAKFIDTTTNKKRQEFGRGIIIKGKYLSTCYHVVNPVKNERLIFVQATFNERPVNGKIVFDSVFATKAFKA